MVKLTMYKAIKHLAQTAGNRTITVYFAPHEQAPFFIVDHGANADISGIPINAVKLCSGRPDKFFALLESMFYNYWISERDTGKVM